MNCPSCQAENEEQAPACAQCGTRLALAPTEVLISVDLRPGSVFHGRYEILGPLGRGGMGMVYKARDRSLDETVAIKVLRPDFGDDPRMAERFRSEIKLARKVRHRNVCAIHDYGEDRGLLYISMELLEGRDLKRVLREKGSLAHQEAYDIAIQIAEGLQAVHDAGIIHRDLKTPNIMRDGQGVARLMDFGIAKRQGEGTVTAAGHIVGTPEYMSPEQAQGHKVDFRSDIYALGIVIYEIFAGTVPFRGETPISTILKHINEPPPLDGPAAARIPPELKPVLRRCLAKDPSHRFGAARDLAEALRLARSPSRRQQPISTDVLQAPTLVRKTEPAQPTLAEPRASLGRRSPLLQPWLLVVPAIVVGGGAWIALRNAGVAERPAEPPAAAALPSVAALPSAAPSHPSSIVDSNDPVPVPSQAAIAAAPHRIEPPASPSSASRAAASAPRVSIPSRRPPLASPRPAPSSSRAPLAAAQPSAIPVATPAAPSPSVPAPPATTLPAVSQEPGLLQVAVQPWGEVIVDGKVLGTTPLDRISLSPGPHSVRVKHPAYEPWERQVVIRSGQIERVVVDLPKVGVRRQP